MLLQLVAKLLNQDGLVGKLKGRKSMEQHQGLVINSLKTSKDLIGSDFPHRCEAWRPDVGFVVAPLPAVEVYHSHPSTFRFVASV